uniref:TonB-dependent receptor n=1 Tax=Phenylobacterium glaciei TaxID=2803784 RepID=A0A974P6F3_9CAUL|nr:TonB-dependent receptor [Phenylobacterium glaciei]
MGVLFRNDDWSISLSDKYTGEQWAAEGEPAAYRIDPYHSADLSVVYRFGAYRLEGAIYNLFDSQQATSIKPGKTVPYDQYYFQPERNAQVSVKVNF